jgi:hypothetical protein
METRVIDMAKKKSFEEKQFEDIKKRYDKNKTLSKNDIERLINQVGTLRDIVMMQEFLEKYGKS